VSTRPIFPALANARSWYRDSGYIDWTWWPGFKESDLIQFAYDYAEAFTQADGEWHDDQLVAAFLSTHGQDPTAHGLTPDEQTRTWLEAKRAADSQAARSGRTITDAKARAARLKGKRGG
jgi:hypothetical protein